MKLVRHPELARMQLRSGGARGVRAAAELLLSAAKAQTPVDSGYLRDSGGVQAEGLRARVGFSAPYAAVVHEKQRKYLEDPMNDPALRQQILTVFAREMVVG